MRRLRFPLALAALVVITGIAVAALQPRTAPHYLSPRDPGPLGTRALAQILGRRGAHVVSVTSVQEAERAARAGATLVVTIPGFLKPAQLAALARLPTDRFLVEPDASELHALAPGLSVSAHVPAAAHGPGCGLAAARLAGGADTGGITLHSAVPAQQCYPAPAQPSLVRYTRAGRAITVLGTGMPLTNGSLANRGNAALALNLLAGAPVIVWLTPSAAAAAGTGHSGVASLLPGAAYLVALQLAVAVVVTAVWRARRLGPLVAEPLPVVVRASETVEGHGRLYRSRHARDRAAAILRQTLIDRLAQRLELQWAEPGTITAAVAARSGRDAAAVGELLFGPVPGTDAALVELASTLDTLESEVT